MRNSPIGMIAFLVAFISFSALSPIETTDAAEILSALDNNGSAVSISTANNTIDLSLSADTAGAVRTASDVVTVTAGSSGYQLYISTIGANNALVRDGTTGTNANDIIPASTVTSISSPAVLTNNTWGFAVPARNATSGSGSEDVVANGFGEASTYPTGDNSVATSKFIAIPAKGDDLLVAKRSSATPSSGNPTNFYYGVRATTAKPSGLYKATVTYTAIGDSITNNLASVTPERTNKLTGGELITISTPSTTALSSLGTITALVGGEPCLNPTATKNDSYVNVTCSAPALATGWHEVSVNFATAGETYIVNPGIEYYANEPTLTMQGFTSDQCGNLAVGSTITLTDTRDNNTYTVAKLPDNNCWMSQNLRLGNNADNTATRAVTLTSADTDIADSSYTFSLATSDIQTSGTDDWSTNYDTKHAYSYINSDSISVENKRLYGTLYNWYTATAGTGTQNGVIGGADAPSSICPKGWKLPPNTGNGSYNDLTSAAGITNSSDGSTRIRSVPYSFLFSGGYLKGEGSQGVYGNFWSRTSYFNNNDAAHYMDIYSDYVIPQNAGPKYYGLAVRCYFAPAMQDFTTTICNNLNTAKTITLTDTRDLNTYTAAKLPDGNCWMTSNLRLGNNSSNTTLQAFSLTAADSDITDGSTFALATSDMQTSGTDNWSSNYDSKHLYSFIAKTTNDGDIYTEDNKRLYGNLYNWYTATAGTGTQNGVTGGADAPMSICPSAGDSSSRWRLPPNSGNGSYVNLFQIPASNGGLGMTADSGSAGATNKVYTEAMQAAPYSFVLSGGYSSGLDRQGYLSSYWLRTSGSSNNNYATGFDFFSDGIFALRRDNGGKYTGRAVRCVMTTS